MTGAGPGRWWWKRPLDLAVAAGLLVPWGLVGVIVAGLVRIRLGRPILFTQERPGLHGVPFRLIKFRTMLPENAGEPSTDSARLTPFGSWLRATSLDELPELWNVIRGEMSFVGPRPLLLEYLVLYDANQTRRMEALPGITGWAQVNGRNAASWPERFAGDLWYVDNASPWLDVKILVLTVGVVLRKRGVNQPGHATMERFRGND